MIAYDSIVETVRDLCLDTLFNIREDVRFALQEAREKESEPARTYLDLLLRNAEIAPQEKLPLHQDTGIPSFFVQLGIEVELEGVLQAALDEGVRRALQEYPTRPSILRDPLNFQSQTTDTTPSVVHIELVQGDHLKLTCVRTSASCELGSRVALLSPPYTASDVKRFLVEAVRSVGVIPEPPMVIGVAIGGSLESVMGLAKKALLRPIGKPHQMLEYARLEQELLENINEIGLGPGGIGGLHTALAVHVEVAPTQEDAVPLAVTIQSHALRIQERIILSEVD